MVSSLLDQGPRYTINIFEIVFEIIVVVTVSFGV